MNSDWSGTFSQPDHGLFFSELGEMTDERTPNHPLVVQPPLVLSQGASQQNTPAQISEHEQYFIEQLDERLYGSSLVTTPVDSSKHQQQQQQHQHHHHQQLQHQHHQHQHHQHHHQQHHVGEVVEPQTDHGASEDRGEFDHLFVLPDEMAVLGQTGYGVIQLPSSQGSQNASTMVNTRHNVVPGAGRKQQDMKSSRPRAVRHFSDSSSTAFPPSSSAYPPQTPSMMANKSIQSTSQPPMALPILPSQNEKLYNELHFFYKTHLALRTPQDPGLVTTHPPSQHVRPDAIFTPLVLPAVTPLESQVNLNNGTSSFLAPVAASFEPLTLPALAAQQDKRRTLSSLYGPSEDSKTGPVKRKTPHGTPVLQTNPKQSPAYKGNKISTGSVFEKLPEASVDSKTSSGSNTPMLPPQGKIVEIKHEQPTMMGFTMGRLAEQQSGPISGSSGSPSGSHSNHNYKRHLYNSKLLPKSLLSSETLPALTALESSIIDDKDDDSNGTPGSNDNDRLRKSVLMSSKLHPTKKASHKVAEQGRRNRMNVAIHDLATLIPKYYHDEVAIPSKATTVELASKYIKSLLKELDEARSR